MFKPLESNPDQRRVQLTPDAEEDLRAGIADVESGRFLPDAEVEAHLRWLETGEGDPWGESSG